MTTTHRPIAKLNPGDVLASGATVVSVDPAPYPRGWLLVTLEGGRWTKPQAHRPTDTLAVRLEGDASAPVEGCARCSGTGRLEAFAHVRDGICFECDGTGK